MSGIDGASSKKSSPWEDFYEKPLPSEATKTAANVANAPWLATPTPGREVKIEYPAAIFSNPAMFAQPVALAKPPPPPPAKPAPLTAAPNAWRGITLAPLADGLPGGTRTDASRAFTCGAGYKLYPEVARQPDGKDALVYWKAFNTQEKRVEFIVGPDALAVFTSAPGDFAVAAANGFMGGQDAVTIESAKVVDILMRDGLDPALRQLGKAQRTAWTDPSWVARTTANVVSSVGPSTVVAAEVRLEARAAAAEAAAAKPSATGFVQHVNNDLPLGKIDGTRTMNCANCAIATDASMAGSPASALPGDLTHASELSSRYGKSWSPVMTTRADLEAAMQQAGPGSRGIVFGRSPNARIGHFFNVTNEAGEVRFVDGQVGGAASLGGYGELWLLRTN